MFQKFLNSLKTSENTVLIEAIQLGYQMCFEESYKGEHEAPEKSDIPIHNMTSSYPEDIYSNDAPRLYGDNQGDGNDMMSIAIIQSVKNKPNALVKIYRAVPYINFEIDKKIKTLNDIIVYYDKFKFFPLKNNTIHELQDKYSIDKYDYDKQQELILEDICQQLKSLYEQREQSIRINPGDWVTINKNYAKEHGEGNLKKYKIVTKTVRAAELFTFGDSIHEWGYDP